MVDYAIFRKSRNMASNAVHVFLNIMLGIAAVLVTVLTNSPVFGVILVIVSKWRVFAVRRRYIMLNLKSNLVDFIVGFSVVALAYFAGASLMPIHFALMVFYVVWLLFIKPMSSESMLMVQSLVAVFIGISASAIMTAELDAIWMVLLAFAIGYAASRHVLAQTDDRDFRLTTLVCGLIFAEIAWLSHAWAIIYTFGESGIRVPQVALILTIFAFIYNYARQVMIRMQTEFRFRNIAVPLIFSIALIAVVIVFFSKPIFNI